MRILGGVVCVLLVAGGCTSDDGAQARGGEDQPTTTEPPVFPDDEWPVGDAERLGFDHEVLERVAADAETYGSRCLLVIRHGEVAGEWFWNDTGPDTKQRGASMTKSWTSTLVGIAQDEGLLDVDDNVSDYVDAWVGTPSEQVTIRNLLSNDSGRHSPLKESLADLAPFAAAEDRTAYGVTVPPQDHQPGTVWSYNDPAIQVLEAVLEEATGQDPVAYLQAKLLDPIGATHTSIDTDLAGNPWVGGGIQTTCRDAARLGYLVLRKGTWDGVQVVSEEWVEAATSPSQERFPAYGYLWWLNEPSDRPLASEGVELFAEYDAAFGDQKQMIPEAPEDMFWALGAFGQIVQVDPGTDTVVVRMGDAHPGGEGSYHHLPWLTRVVTDGISSQNQDR